ncbi:hypothetical protein ACW5XI_16330 [Aeromonas australiensis]
MQSAAAPRHRADPPACLPLQQLDRAQIHHQLEQLVHAASEIGNSR